LNKFYLLNFDSNNFDTSIFSNNFDTSIFSNNFDTSIFSNNFDTNNIIIQDNKSFYYSLTTINSFILSIYAFYIFYYLFLSNTKNIYSLTLAFIYSKYSLNVFLNDNITLLEYEYSRAIMWVFATPLMLKLYCNTNQLKLKDINFLYHYIPCFTYIIVFPFKNNLKLYYTYFGLSCILIFLFIKKLMSMANLKFTKIFISIWIMFIVLHLVELTKIMDRYKLNILYLTADMIGKVVTNYIIHDNIEQKYTIKNNIDLQCINFIKYLLNKIDKYKKNNKKQSQECINLIKYTTDKLNIFIPEKKDHLQIELLKKILPFGFEKEYIVNVNANANANANANYSNKSFKNICVLFTDIVSYTELAQKYEDKIIFELLNNVYIKFDNIIKKYYHLQKIETIGDAYMVVGDIFRDIDNYKTVVKEIILLAIDLIQEIKSIETPDNIPLSIRVGINIGPIVAGILGNEIPRLCIVGNTVNIASRLQTTTEKNTIQISNDIYEIAKKIYFDKNIEYTFKKDVFLKNIGSINTYIINMDNE
jgi:class 3 adenylate cyclase